MRLLRGSRVLAGLVTLAACGVGGSGPSDGSAPQVAITAPANGATVGLQVNIDVIAVDDYGVDKIRILIDGTLRTEIFSPPFRYVWNTGSLAHNSVHVIRV